MRADREFSIPTSKLVAVGWLSMIAAVGFLTAAIIYAMALGRITCTVGLRVAGVLPFYSCGDPNSLEIALGWLVVALIYGGAGLAIVAAVMVSWRLILRRIEPGARFAAVCYLTSAAAVLLITVANFIQTAIMVPGYLESSILFVTTAMFTVPTLLLSAILCGILSAIREDRMSGSDTSHNL